MRQLVQATCGVLFYHPGLNMPQSTSSLVSLNNAGIRGAGLKGEDRWLVRGVDFAVSRGEIVTLIGPNGSGKSTSAKMALGILKPDEGKASRLPSLRVGYVPQKLSVDWTVPLTVKRFMRLTARVSPKKMQSALASTGVAHLLAAEVRMLSGGEFQRVLLARAIAREPDLLVLDEPVQGVDFTGEIAIYELISSLRHQMGCGVLLISHDLHVVMAATDKVVCLNGHVCCSGSPKSVVQSAEYRELFGLRAASALAVYEHNHDHTHLADGRVCSAQEVKCDEPAAGPGKGGGSGSRPGSDHAG